jgi:plastocyanin
MVGTFGFHGAPGARAGVAAATLALLAGVVWMTQAPPRNVALAAGPQRVQIQMKNFAYAPAAITINAGQTLTWTNDDVVPHTTTADLKTWDSGQLAPGRSFTVTVRKPGTYAYTCSIHPFMHAKIVVK